MYMYAFIVFACVSAKQAWEGGGESEEGGGGLLNGQKLELCCDVKAVCKDVLDMVVAHIGLVEHHLFSLAYLKGA